MSVPGGSVTDWLANLFSLNGNGLSLDSPQIIALQNQAAQQVAQAGGSPADQQAAKDAVAKSVQTSDPSYWDALWSEFSQPSNTVDVVSTGALGGTPQSGPAIAPTDWRTAIPDLWAATPTWVKVVGLIIAVLFALQIAKEF